MEWPCSRAFVGAPAQEDRAGGAILYFPNNSDQLDAEAIQAIEAVVQPLMAYPGVYSRGGWSHLQPGIQGPQQGPAIGGGQVVVKVLGYAGILAVKVSTRFRSPKAQGG